VNADKRKASIALGVFVIALVFILETVIADHARPNPLSPVVWTALATLAAVSLAACLWFSARARRTR
jgi:RsiW-degrading membrane proteinase PrsW (M82 family)